MNTIYLAAGCFWGAQKFFDQFDGIVETTVGYANGPTKDPWYEAVCHHSGHAETVKVVYDENIISLTEILNYYFMIIDPVSVNRQGMDFGIQYRTGIYYEGEKPGEIDPVIRAEDEKVGGRLAVEVKPLENFYDAENYHQKYLDKEPYGYCHIPWDLLHLKDREK